MTDENMLVQRVLDAYVSNPTEENLEDAIRFMLSGPERLRRQAAQILLKESVEDKKKLQAATSSPLLVGVVVEPCFSLDGGEPLALVRLLPSGSLSVCQVFPGLRLRVGDRVVLTNNHGAVLERVSPYRGSDIGRVERLKSDTNELVLRGTTSEETIVAVSDALRNDPALKPGCKVRYSPQIEMATGIEEAVDEVSAALADGIPDYLTWDHLGGMEEVKGQLYMLQEILLASEEELASQGLSKRLLALFTGKPGTGKTYAARILCMELRRRIGRERVAFVFIKAADLLDPFVGKSEANIRERFAYVRTLADKGLIVIMVWDEFEGLFYARGRHYASTIVDHTLTPTLLSELDGMAPLGNLLMVAITNRPDLVDSALMRPGRLGGLAIAFRRPNWPESQRIFEIHLEDKRLAAGFTVEELAERAAAYLFANPDENKTAVAAVRFQDGRRELIGRPALLSGDVIRDACESAATQAWLRSRRGAPQGITPHGLAQALDGAFASYAGLLKPWNLMDYLDWSLDKMQQVVAVEAVTDGGPGPAHRYFASP